MTEREDLLASIASTIKDYRTGEIAEPTPTHVDRWIGQFEPAVQVPMLRELNNVFQRTYVSQPTICRFLAGVADQFSFRFWQSAHILSIQKKGESQAEIRKLFGEILKERYDLNIEYDGSDNGDFVYLDDAVFTGDHVIGDLVKIIERIPRQARLHIILIASHSYAEYRINNRIKQQINVRFNRKDIFENRQTWHNEEGGLAPTDVLRPDEIGKRDQNQRASCFFSSVEGRQLLEREFLSAGKKIQRLAKNPDPNLKPLGYNTIEPGFGSLFVTYRNCPNNCPLALWYGDPSYPQTHPLGLWYPLFPRKTYHQ